MDNLLAGSGPVYNVGERVQAYTHPLWLALLALLRPATGELYYTTLALSALLTLLTVHVLFRMAPAPGAVTGSALLLGSKAFIDYSTSGLENPLSHLLLALFLWTLFRQEKDPLPALAGLASLATLSRPDLLLLCLPPLLLLARPPSWPRARRAVLAMSPLLAWLVFSLIYYGAPAPNTAYAKLGAGIPRLELLAQGAHYLGNSLRTDPLTLLAILAGTAAALGRRRPRELAVAAGIAIYLLYVVWIGGDFMSGRFLTAPLLAAAVLVARTPLPPRPVLASLAAIALLALPSARAHLLSGRDFGDVPTVPTELGPLPMSLVDAHGISDERAFYYQATGLLRRHPGAFPDHPWARRGIALSRKGRQVEASFVIGMVGYFAGPEVHLVDPNGLNDFLLARLPIPAGEPWRIGHLTRALPAGYLETLETGRNVIADPGLARDYEVARRVVAGDLLGSGRLRDIVRVNLLGLAGAGG